MLLSVLFVSKRLLFGRLHQSSVGVLRGMGPRFERNTHPPSPRKDVLTNGTNGHDAGWPKSSSRGVVNTLALTTSQLNALLYVL